MGGKVEKTPPAAEVADYANALVPALCMSQCLRTSFVPSPCHSLCNGQDGPYAVLVIGVDQTGGSVSPVLAPLPNGTNDTWQNPTSGSAL